MLSPVNVPHTLFCRATKGIAVNRWGSTDVKRCVSAFTFGERYDVLTSLSTSSCFR
ncbi:MAG: hypothetical protein KatS3mg058_1472 [Roseiflexus sp.]|nr:MAG: hypothetical protein KatS3mg058_1472 [Roseiflexus sp.]